MKQKSRITIRHVFKTIIWPRRKYVLIGLVLIVISRLAGLVLPGATKYLMDDVIAKHDLHMLRYLLLAVVAAIVIQAVTSFLLTRILSVEAQRLISVLRAQVQRKILRLPVRFFDNSKSGALVSRIMTDVEGVRNLVGTGLVQLVGGLLTAIISLVLLIRISPIMTLYVLVPVAVFGLISMKRMPYNGSDHFAMFIHLQYDESLAHKQEVPEADRQELEEAAEKATEAPPVEK